MVFWHCSAGTVSVCQYIALEELDRRWHVFGQALVCIIDDWKIDFGQRHLGVDRLVRVLGEENLYQATEEEEDQLKQQEESGLGKFYEYAGKVLDDILCCFIWKVHRLSTDCPELQDRA